MTHKERILILKTYGVVMTFYGIQNSLHVRFTGPRKRMSTVIDGSYTEAVDTLYDFLMDRMHCEVDFMDGQYDTS